METPNGSYGRLTSWALALGSLSLVLGLAAYGYFALFMRPSGDDYCYGGALSQYGFWRAWVASYLGTAHFPFHGDRYALTFFSLAYSALAPRSYGLVISATLVAWVAAMTWVIRNALGILGMKGRALLSIYAASAIVFLTVLQAPDRMQSVFWRSAMIPYLMPIVFIWLTLGVILASMAQGLSLRWAMPSAFFLAFVAGGLSEVGAVYQLTCFALILFLVLVLHRKQDPARRRLLLLVAAALAGSLLAVVMLVSSPFSQSALSGREEVPSIGALVLRPLRWAAAFTWLTLKGLPIPTAVAILLGVPIGLQFDSRRGPRLTPRRTARWAAAGMLVTALIGISLVASVYVAPYYARLQSPEPRVQLMSRHATVLMFFAFGVWAGAFSSAMLRTRKHLQRATLLAVSLLGIMLAAYPVRSAHQTIQEATRRYRWATEWDQRDQAIRLAVAAGSQDIHVSELDHPIPHVGELNPDPSYWYNQCAAQYYGVQTLSADLPAQ